MVDFKLPRPGHLAAGRGTGAAERLSHGAFSPDPRVKRICETFRPPTSFELKNLKRAVFLVRVDGVARGRRPRRHGLVRQAMSPRILVLE